MKNITETQSEIKQSILAVAERLFADYGFDQTSILQIAQTADLSAATVTDNFKSKTAILTEIFSGRLEQLSRMLISVPELQMPVPDRFRVFSNICSLISDNPYFLRLLQREITYWPLSPVRNLIETSIFNMLQVLARLVDAAIDDSYINPADARLAYLLFFSLMPIMGMGAPVATIINQALDPGGYSFSAHRLSEYLISLLRKK